MMDVPAEAFVLLALAAGLWAWKRGLGGRMTRALGIGSILTVGLFAGLAVLTKLNGALGLMVLGAWAGLALVLRPFPRRRRVAVLAIVSAAGFVALAEFVTLNPFLYAHPTGPMPPRMIEPADPGWSLPRRLAFLFSHRAEVLNLAPTQFPDDALKSAGERVAAVAVQGFGRFGPFGPRDHSSTVPYPRYSWSRDVSAVVWLPLVVLGAGWAAVAGARSIGRGEPPVEWAILGYWAVAILTVGAFLPLAWDRYFLPIQAPSALLVAGMAVSALRVARKGGAVG
jgi:hypothetical protein